MSKIEIKAVTISQPWASLIARGEKWIENRTWSTNYRGELAIHAGKGLQYLTKEDIKQYPTGCIIAVGQLVACERLDTIQQMSVSELDQHDLIHLGAYRTWSQAAIHHYAEGPWCWILEDVQPVDHFPCKGAQGLWNINRWLLGLK